jgi:hypothetical protein
MVSAKKLFGSCEAELLAHESVEAVPLLERVPARQTEVNNSSVKPQLILDAQEAGSARKIKEPYRLPALSRELP